MFTDPQSTYVEQFLVFYLIAYKASNQNMIQKINYSLGFAHNERLRISFKKAIASLTSYSR